MKYFNLIVLLLVVHLSAQSQIKKPSAKPLPKSVINPNGFTGIGIFKIGVDTGVVYKYADTLNMKVLPMTNNEQLSAEENTNNDNKTLDKNSDKSVYRIFRNADFYGLSYCPGAVEYFINEYIVAGIKLFNVRLIFYKNKLIELNCEDSESIRDAMKVKYGISNLSKEIKHVSCVYNLTGITRDLTETTYYSKWTNGSIGALSLLSEHYNDKCEKSILTGFSYYIKNVEYNQCERSHLDDNLKPKANALKLKDF